MEHTFAIFADFHQFVLRDAQADWADLADRWTPEAVQAMFVQGPAYVAVGTARDAVVPVVVRVRSSAPMLPAGSGSRRAHGSLPVPTGELVITGVTDNGATGGRVAVPPGSYEVLVQYEGLDTVTPDRMSGEDRYLVDVWPATG